MDLHLTGKTALVSGSTAGIGLAIAKELAQEGANVTINGRTAERVQRAIEEIRATHPKGKIAGVAADLATATGTEVLFQQLPQVDILINNLGIFEPKEFAEISDAEWVHFF
jgi:NAD(P)-dependent dehydrogenase (short-subunit alcohol dehydrogenase family)